MRDHVIRIAEDFWNIRGSFKIARVLDIGTQASLVRRPSGGFLLLDSYTFTGSLAEEVDEITGGPENVEAVLNLHPFHTIHVRAIHERYPRAKHYGTARHLSRAPDLPWQAEKTEDAALHELFAEDFEFSVPRGVVFVAANEHLHFSSVLALHRASKTIHVDDTLMYVRFPGLLRILGLSDTMSFHPTLGKVLEPRAGAARDFREWAEELIESWGGAENLCAAHTAALRTGQDSGPSLRDRLKKALAKVESTLGAHQQKFG
jgi:hypothetical protein